MNLAARPVAVIWRQPVACQADDLLANQRVTGANAFHKQERHRQTVLTTSSKELSNKVAHAKEQQAFVVAMKNTAIQIAAFDPPAETEAVLLLNRDLSWQLFPTVYLFVQIIAKL